MRTSFLLRGSLLSFVFTFLVHAFCASGKAEDLSARKSGSGSVNASSASDLERYCSNIADSVAAAELAWQEKRIAELNVQLQTRISELEAKRKDYEGWVAKQEALRKKADDTIVTIFSKMKPEAAAAQMTLMDDETAAAVLMKLNARNASTILNEIAPARAARLTEALAKLKRNSEEKTP